MTMRGARISDVLQPWVKLAVNLPIDSCAKRLQKGEVEFILAAVKRK